MASMERYRVDGKNDWKLGLLSPDDHAECPDKPTSLERLIKLKERLAEQQQRLYAGNEFGFLLVLQGMDAGGKDGAIRNVMSGVNPQGCHVSSFKGPSPVELNHDYLWRIHISSPARGRFNIFNRSHYEDVVAVRVHADRLLPAWAKRRKNLWEERFEQINNFEKLLNQNNIITVKCYLHISKDEQKARLERRLEDPSRNWKFSPADLAERQHWDEYVKAYEDAIRNTSTAWAPWYIIPANRKWYRNLVIAEIIVNTLEKLKLEYPKADPNLLRDIKIS